ncbi:unnamed protein product [Parascedosporium putredinis]|uniref:MARVEL domain-containing protein n=1 Tax=Parascedosporium putredinis TaxID=1442378 RepID=A0A9P1MDS9_9PEZI|nr:unnamed protein product [Parascedosporium putredinis]CAI8004253.1 unnamed protein product [Parascedosporium putredinis]
MSRGLPSHDFLARLLLRLASLASLAVACGFIVYGATQFKDEYWLYLLIIVIAMIFDFIQISLLFRWRTWPRPFRVNVEIAMSTFVGLLLTIGLAGLSMVLLRARLDDIYCHGNSYCPLSADRIRKIVFYTLTIAAAIQSMSTAINAVMMCVERRPYVVDADQNFHNQERSPQVQGRLMQVFIPAAAYHGAPSDEDACDYG